MNINKNFDMIKVNFKFKIRAKSLLGKLKSETQIPKHDGLILNSGTQRLKTQIKSVHLKD